ncbi:MAG: mechanosensitive ion channel domain-containing protein [Planctomycetota bacterium]
MLRPFALLVPALAFLVLGPLAAATAQGEITTNQDPEFSAPERATIERTIAELESAAPANTVAIEQYQKALTELRKAEIAAAEAERLTGLATQAPDDITTIQAELANPPQTPEISVPDTISLTDLSVRVEEAEADQRAADQRVQELEREAQNRSERLRTLQSDIAEARDAVTRRESSLRALPPPDSPQSLARRTLLLAELHALRANETLLSAERTSYEARRELLPLRRDRADRVLQLARATAAPLRSILTTREQEAASDAAAEAEQQRQEMAAEISALAPLLERNAELSAMRIGESGVLAEIADLRTDQRELEGRTEKLSASANSTLRRVEAGALSDGIGTLLRRQYDLLRATRTGDLGPSNPSARLSEVAILSLDLEEEETLHRDLGAEQSEIVERIQSENAADQIPPTAELEVIVRDLLEKNRTYRSQLQDDLSELSDRLQIWLRELDRFDRLSTAYRLWIEERILWVPSSRRALSTQFSKAIDELPPLTSGENWSTIASDTGTAIAHRPLVAVMPFLVGMLAFAFRSRMKKRFQTVTDQVRSHRTDRFGFTVEAVLLVCACALPGPMILWALGHALTLPSDGHPIATALGSALQETAVLVFALSALRFGCKPKGLTITHFRWPERSVELLREQLRWAIPALAISLFFVRLFDELPSTALSDSLGRLAFVAAMVTLSVWVHHTLRPGSELLDDQFRKTQSLLSKTHRAWYLILLLAPIALIALALIGYFYTAHRLEERLRASLGLFLGLVLINALSLRGLFIQRRRLAIERARQRIQAQAAETAEDSAEARELGAAPVDEEALDIPAIDQQTRHVIRSGIFAAALVGIVLIWSNTFPALRALERITLWSTEDVASSSEAEVPNAPILTPSVGSLGEQSPTTDERGGSETSETSVDDVQPDLDAELLEKLLRESVIDDPTTVSLADLLTALLIFGFTAILTRNVPGLLEIAVLRRLPLDAGARYALTTLTRYITLIFGISAGFGAIHIGWDTIQWLAAALTFGLAFGLQEIFANFVSGIIILLERPVRAGDMVTVNGIEGRVTKLRMRSTTILDWDRRELLIPNKEFITGTVVNWTLSDPVTRVIIPVGIAYGSDTKLARKLLLQVAKENSLVLNDPKPTAIFRSFGASSLDFDLRVFMQDRDLWPALVDQLHSAIDDAFREANIEIAFPQRDLHIRSAEGLPFGPKISDASGSDSEPTAAP